MEYPSKDLHWPGAYGDIKSLAAYCRRRHYRSLLLDGEWQHGWHVPEKNIHPELVVGFDGESRLFRTSRKYYVAREDQRVFLRQCGYTRVEAIGHPIIYVARPRVQRISGSLLIMPVHSVVESVTIRDRSFEAYLAYIQSIRHHFHEVSACIHSHDLDYYGVALRNLGINIIEGSLMADQNSYRKMALLGCSYDYMTTNKYGSHVAYFAYYGCRVSVAGPAPGLDYQKFRDLNIYRNCPECLPLSLSINQSLGTHYPSFRVEPWLATSNIEWAQEQLGEACKQPPAYFQRRLTRRRLFLEKIKHRIGPSPLLRCWAALLTTYNTIQSRLFENKKAAGPSLVQSFRVPSKLICVELVTLYRFAKTLRHNSVGAEIGSHLGATAIATISGCAGKQFKLYCMDTWIRNTAELETNAHGLAHERHGKPCMYSQFCDNTRACHPYLEPITMGRAKDWPELLPANTKLSWLFIEDDDVIESASWERIFCPGILEPDALVILHCTGWPDPAKRMVSKTIINHCILEKSLPNLKVFRYIGAPTWVLTDDGTPSPQRSSSSVGSISGKTDRSQASP